MSSNSINTNTNAIAICNILNRSNNSLSKTLTRMASGLKLQQAKDDAAGAKIATKMSVRLNALNIAQENIQNGTSLLNVAEGAYDEITNILTRLRNLSLQGADTSCDTTTREALQKEANQLYEELERIQKSTKFNNQKLFDNFEEKKSPQNQNSPPAQTTSTFSLRQSPLMASSILSEGTSSYAISTMSLESEPSLLSKLQEETSGAFDFEANETKIITINGHDYEIKNRNTTTASLSYSVGDDGAITLSSNYFTIKALDDSAQSYIINGTYNYIYGGGGDDTFKNYDTYSKYNYVYGGAGDDVMDFTTNNYLDGQDGNDNITMASWGAIYGGAGDDIITAKNSSPTIYGDDGTTPKATDGNDTINLIGGGSSIVYGGGGDDVFNVSTSNNKIYGNDGEDEFNIIKGSNNTIDGGSGTNSITDNGTNTSSVNVPGANSGSVSFNKNETKDIEINGITYTVKNRTSAQDFLYKIETSGQINFLSNNFTITGQEDTAHNVILGGNSIYFYGGNKDDTVVSNGSSNYIFTNDGNDDVTMANQTSSVYLGGGDDILRLKGNYNQIYTEEGNDKILLYGNYNYSYLDLGNGDDEIYGVNSNGTINNTRTLRATVVMGGEGNDTYSLTNKSTDSLIDINENEFTCVKLDPNEAKDIEINNITYTIKNRWTTSGQYVNVYYKYDEIEDKIIFAGDNVTITGQKDVAHNVEIYGNRTYFYGGDENDNVTIVSGYNNQVYGQGGNDNLQVGINTSSLAQSSNLFGGAGDDTLIGYSGSVGYYGGSNSHSSSEIDGDDIIYVYNSASALDGGKGNDTYYINKSTSSIDNYGNNVYYINADSVNFSAGAGDDTFYANGSKNTILGAGGDDYFIINGNNNAIDGGTGTNYYVNNGTGSTITNAQEDPGSGIVSFSYKGEVKLLEMDGKLYTITNQNADNTSPANNSLTYSYNATTGEVMFQGANLTIDCEDDVANKIRLIGANNTINGGDKNDVIIVQTGSNNIINGNGGNDTITLEDINNSAIGGSGSDTININASTTKLIDGGSGNDAINVNSNNNTNIKTGNGNDIVRSTASVSGNKINLQNGSSNLLLNGNNNYITSGVGDNKITMIGSENTIETGTGKNTIGINGSSNTVNTQNGSTINLQGNENELSSSGKTEFNVSGNLNIISSSNGIYNVKGAYNTITSDNGGTYKIIGNENNINSEGTSNYAIDGNSNILNATNGVQNLYVTGHNNNLDLTSDSAVLSLNGDNNNLNLTSESAKLTSSGNENVATLDILNSSILNIKGNENNIEQINGSSNVVLKGNSNILSTADKNDKVEIRGDLNNIISQDGNNKYTLYGNSNTVTGGNGIDNFTIKKGNNNSIDGGDTVSKNTLYNMGTATQSTNVMDITPVPFKLSLQVGFDAGETIDTELYFSIGAFEIDLSSRETSLESLVQIDDILNQVNAQKSNIGAVMSRLESTFQLNQNNIANLQSSKSLITDCDIAQEAIKHTKNSIFQNISVAMMSQSYKLRQNYLLNFI